MRALKCAAWLFLWIVASVCIAWSFGALYYDLPIESWRNIIAVPFLFVLLGLLFFLRGQGRKLLAIFFVFFPILIWWLTLEPSNNRKWQPDVAETAWADVEGDLLTFHNVRNCEYRTETDYTPRWETRAVHLSQIVGIDLVVNYWGSPYMAHPIVSFEIGDSPPICFSIETRKEIGESYSAIGGFYRQYELIYLCADERDVIRVRTNYRRGEDAYLYRTVSSPEQAQKRFLEYVDALNSLRNHPRWYNAATTNCTTSIRAQRPTDQRLPWDWRILINGKADEMLYERKLIATGGLSFRELKERSKINDRARAADQDPDFSRVIRQGLPGFSQK